MILPDRTIVACLVAQSSHTLFLAQQSGIIATTPDIVVIGTGSPGMMQPEQTLSGELESRGVATKTSVCCQYVPVGP